MNAASLSLVYRAESDGSTFQLSWIEGLPPDEQVPILRAMIEQMRDEAELAEDDAYGYVVDLKMEIEGLQIANGTLDTEASDLANLVRDLTKQVDTMTQTIALLTLENDLLKGPQ